MLTKSETDYEIEYIEKGEGQLTPSIDDLITYNLKRVGCSNVKEVGSYTTDGEAFYQYTFKYKGELPSAKAEGFLLQQDNLLLPRAQK